MQDLLTEFGKDASKGRRQQQDLAGKQLYGKHIPTLAGMAVKSSDSGPLFSRLSLAVFENDPNKGSLETDCRLSSNWGPGRLGWCRTSCKIRPHTGPTLVQCDGIGLPWLQLQDEALNAPRQARVTGVFADFFVFRQSLR